ncbi:hypothetical protein [Streptomyces sp. NRRL F-2747]|uniref:hypothetical protein n=1 Tax=Streptomyces sp. NRRL F-2747 TaxID=1463843 RepID=UPI0004C7B43D|nr:hypothetical protein [Streptomyces sp. NRRL F-2747]
MRTGPPLTAAGRSKPDSPERRQQTAGEPPRIPRRHRGGKAAADTRPWFAYVTPYASHGPRTPEAEYAGAAVPDSVDGRSLLSSHSRDHLLVEWWKQGPAAGGPPTWASYVSREKQYARGTRPSPNAHRRSRHALLLHPRTR